MNFVVYCMFLHTIMLLVVIIMICNDLWGFLSIPLILVITLQFRKTMFCVFLRFRNLLELILTWIFRVLIFYHENLLEHQKSTREAMRPKRAQGSWAPSQAAPPMLKRASRLQCRPSSSPDAQLDLKTPIKMTPLVFSREGDKET
jgi:hypothetical protein